MRADSRPARAIRIERMKVPMHIYFSSVYGSTKQYAEELARCLGTTAQEIPDPAEVPAAAAEGPIVVLAPAHGPMNAAAKFATRY